MRISFEAYHFYVVDVSYHNSCYINFAIKKKVTVNKDERMENLQNDISEKFLLSRKKRAIHQKEASQLSDLSIYNAIYYTVKDHLKLNQNSYAESLSSDFKTKWATACDWENLLTPGRN